MAEDLLKQLFARRWQPLHTKRRLLSEVAKKGDLASPGVYLLAYTPKTLSGKRVHPNDVFYVGMSNSAGGLRQRFRQFQSSIEGGDGHGPAYRFFVKCGNKRPYSKSPTKCNFYFAALTVPCESRKSEAKPRDFVLMGNVASLEYEAIAHVLQITRRLPRLNDLATAALDDVGA